MTAQTKSMNLLEWGMLAALSIVWGGSFFFAAIAVQEVPPMTVVFVRVAGASLILLVCLRILGVRMPKSRVVWGAFFAMGLMNNVIPFCLIFWAQTELASGVASILNAMTPMFTVIAAHFLTTDEKMTGGRIAGVVLGFGGVAVLIGKPVDGALVPQLAILAAAMSYAFASIFGKRFNALGVAPLATATGQVTASTLILFPVIMLIDKPWTIDMPSIETLLSLAGLVTLSTAFAYFLFFRILSTAGATNLMLVTFLVPPSAILLGVLVLNEVLTARQVAGMIIIGAGLAAIDGRVFKFWKRTP